LTADLLLRFILRPAAAVAGRISREGVAAAITGLTREQWRALGRAFPALGPDPARRAVGARLRLRFLLSRALSGPRHDAVWSGFLGGAPVLFATAHVGDLRGLRYLMRRRIPAANILAPWVMRKRTARYDAAFDRRWQRDFPHVFSSENPHALKTALKRGSLIAAADIPDAASTPFPLLGGTILLDPRPFRLARIAGVPCRPAFLTAPGGRLTMTVGESLPAAEDAALDLFGRAFARVAEQAPFEIDGVTRWGQLP
jgi:hypothetical protein